MPDPRAQQGHEDGLSARWLAALAAGQAVDDVLAEILAHPPQLVVAGIVGLGKSGALAFDLLASIVSSGRADLALAAATALGDVRTDAAAALLDELSRHSEADKAIVKAARRSLVRLASVNVRPQPAAPTVSTPLAARRAELVQVLASAYDGTGSRVLRMAAVRPLGGMYLITVVLNESRGLIECNSRDMTRKRIGEQEAELRRTDPSVWIDLPVLYSRQLVQEGVEAARSAGQLLPSGYAGWAELIGNPPEHLIQPAIYDHVSAFECRMHPTLEGETPRLFEQAEVEAWFFRPEEMMKWLERLSEVTSSRLLVTPETDAERYERVLREAIKELLPASQLSGLRRRLEETALIFWRSDRMLDARRAVQAAVTIQDARPLRPPHPFLHTLVERSMRIAVEVVRSEFEAPRLAPVP